jgi:peptidoglycan/xylan/chitin deacetylase (PgdA/CDA1 family)
LAEIPKLVIVPLKSLFRRSVGPRILMYHSVADALDDDYAVSVGIFRQQLSWLAENGFRFISLASLSRAIKAGDSRALRNKVVLTFDDGYLDFALNALPVLNRYQAAATVFLVTDMLGRTAQWSNRSKHVPLMSKQDVESIKKQGVTLGSHTATHADLTRLDAQELSRQLVSSRAALNELGESFYSLAYPWGRWSKAVAAAVKTCGYDCAVATCGKTRFPGTDAYALPRITIRADLHLAGFRSHFEPPSPGQILRRYARGLRNRLRGNQVFRCTS